MKTTQIGQSTVYQAPIPNGPEVEVLLDDSNRVAVAHVQLAPGAAMPEHDHGESEAIVIVRSGEIEMTSSGQVETVGTETIVLVAVGERVSLRNAGVASASLLAIFSPPGFISTFKSWQ